MNAMTSITIQIPDPTAQRLRDQAEQAGKPIDDLLQEVLEAQAAMTLSLRQISAESAKRFADSGMSEEELAERLEREDHESRGVPYDD
jgi:hypothetical protein